MNMRSWDELHAEAARLAAQEAARKSVKASQDARALTTLAANDQRSPLFKSYAEAAVLEGRTAWLYGGLAQRHSELAKSHARADLRKKGLR
jgi:hypothetical protein